MLVNQVEILLNSLYEKKPTVWKYCQGNKTQCWGGAEMNADPDSKQLCDVWGTATFSDPH